MTEILGNWLFVGDQMDALNTNNLLNNNIGYVFSAIGPPKYLPSNIQYVYVTLKDTPRQDLSEAIAMIVPYLNYVRDHGGRVLVYCHSGSSRSIALIIAYMILEYGYSYDNALAYIRSKYTHAHPNFGFQQQLRALEQRQ